MRFGGPAVSRIQILKIRRYTATMLSIAHSSWQYFFSGAQMHQTKKLVDTFFVGNLMLSNFSLLPFFDTVHSYRDNSQKRTGGTDVQFSGEVHGLGERLLVYCLGHHSQQIPEEKTSVAIIRNNDLFYVCFHWTILLDVNRNLTVMYFKINSGTITKKKHEHSNSTE